MREQMQQGPGGLKVFGETYYFTNQKPDQAVIGSVPPSFGVVWQKGTDRLNREQRNSAHMQSLEEALKRKIATRDRIAAKYGSAHAKDYGYDGDIENIRERIRGEDEDSNRQ